MPCLLALFAIFFPRVVIVLLFLFTTYISGAFETWLWPLLGFIFMPFATLAFAFAQNHGDGLIGLYLAIFVLAVLMDIGSLSGGLASGRRR